MVQINCKIEFMYYLCTNMIKYLDLIVEFTSKKLGALVLSNPTDSHVPLRMN